MLQEAIAELQGLYPRLHRNVPLEQRFISMALGTMALMLVFRWLERSWPENLRRNKSRSEFLVNLAYWFSGPLFARAATVVMGIVAIALLIAHAPRHPGIIAAQPLWAQSGEALLLADFIGYWIHRVMHRVPFLWRLHSIHHSSEDLNWLASARVHPLETIIHRTATGIPLFLFGFSVPIVILAAPILTLYAVFIHANIRWDYGRFGKLIASPRFHHWHHSSDPAAINTNFAGFLPVWDHLFRTAYHDMTRSPESYGLAGTPVAGSFVAQLLQPLRRERLDPVQPFQG